MTRTVGVNFESLHIARRYGLGHGVIGDTHQFGGVDLTTADDGVIFSFVAAALLAGTALLDASREASAAPGQPVVVIVGNCLTCGIGKYIGTALHNVGLSVRVEGLSSRRIALSFDFLGHRDSGVEWVKSLKAAGVSPALWVIQLGTNDLGAIDDRGCPNPVAYADSIIDQLLAEIGSDVPIA